MKNGEEGERPEEEEERSRHGREHDMQLQQKAEVISAQRTGMKQLESLGIRIQMHPGAP